MEGFFQQALWIVERGCFVMDACSIVHSRNTAQCRGATTLHKTDCEKVVCVDNLAIQFTRSSDSVNMPPKRTVTDEGDEGRLSN